MILYIDLVQWSLHIWDFFPGIAVNADIGAEIHLSGNLDYQIRIES